jgi:hypothetical protein
MKTKTKHAQKNGLTKSRGNGHALEDGGLDRSAGRMQRAAAEPRLSTIAA